MYNNLGTRLVACKLSDSESGFLLRLACVLVRPCQHGKCLFEEYDNLGSADRPSKAAKLHGVQTNLSPMRSGKYGPIADDTTSMRLVGFDTAQQRELATHHDKHEE